MSVEHRINQRDYDIDKNDRAKSEPQLGNPNLRYNAVYIKSAYLDKKSVTDHKEPTIDYRLGYRHDIPGQEDAPKDVADEVDGHRQKSKMFQTNLSNFNHMLVMDNKRPIAWQDMTRQATNPEHYGVSPQSRTVMNSHAPLVSANDNIAFRAALFHDNFNHTDKYNRVHTGVHYDLNPNDTATNRVPFYYEDEKDHHPSAKSQHRWLIIDNKKAHAKFDKMMNRLHLPHPHMHQPTHTPTGPDNGGLEP